MKGSFFIDECISPELVQCANDRGYLATHVIFRNLSGKEDHEILPIVVDNDFIFVTNNAKNFKPLYAQLDVHGGLILLLPSEMVVEEQLRLFQLALDAIEAMTDLINKVVEVYRDGTVHIEDFPAPDHQNRP